MVCQKLFIQAFLILMVTLFVKGKYQCKVNNPDYSLNNDPSLPTCQDSPGCLWDLSQCSPCQDSQCICQDYNICDSCTDGYFINNNNVCQQCPPGCAICCQRESLTDYICSQCREDYTLVGGVCIQTLGCRQLIPNSDKCIQCIDGYYLDQSSQCQKCHQNCKTCLTKYDCITCNHIYSNVSDGGICVGNVTPTPPKIQVPDCILKQDESKYGIPSNTDETPNCNPQFYFLDISTGRCRCSQCNDQYYLNYSFTQETQQLSYTCSPCSDKDQNSHRCLLNVNDLNGITIVQCKDGYILDLSSQVCVDNSNSNCRRLFDGDCSDCYDGRYPEQDPDDNFKIKCYEYDKNTCLTPISKGTQCNKCVDGYYLQDNVCQSCNQGCTTSDCKICSKCQTATQCLQCSSGYKLKNGSCSSCTNPYCSQCDQVENVCTKCKPGYGLNTQSKDDTDQCLQCQSNCLVCDVDFRKCTKCSDGFYIQNFVCKKQPDNCILQENGFCIQCAFGYVAQAGYCIKCNNQDIGHYTCPSNCDDSQIQLVDLLYSQVLKNSILFFFIVYFGFVSLPLNNFS
ncbi:Serine/Threonine kinase, putative (macronuclear) [Tetrahymena thermophila SB210]|uniref:Serine/Threonine kinase, putative n=1 Tax=Tetrahymena thermophila (strain SB210) TaxID=312017 RepID=I7LT91_TETTS|nr:Serine/Threonine kinase, putative [Tetrahymena thermophila SB210]EAR84816.1 Serine/Threonine kinase, putative [Tetrahymena thermophila SB210]|eukprot:XP_001032479.1 Serine/Threonine kinase, putative [Tetrahymena thermophila SB210]